MKYYNVVIITLLVVAGARAFHAAYLNRGKTILAKYKGYIAILEFFFLIIPLYRWEIGFTLAVVAAPLFMGVRLFSDYQLNLMRGLPFHYIPKREDKAQDKYLAITDSILRKFNAQTRLALRLIILVMSAVASYLLYIHIDYA